METSHGNSLCSYLKQTKMSFFFFYRMAEQVLPGDGGVGTSGRGEEKQKECRRVNIVQVLCTHVCKWKNDTC
jgi:hypothetical protein